MIRECDAALDARKQEIKLCQLGLTQAVHNNASLAYDIEEKNKQLQSPLRNPLVTILAGAVAGLLAASLLSR